MTETALKSMAGNRDLKAGHFLFEFNTPGIGYIMKEAACDFVIFDTEHSGYGIETVKNVVAYMRAAGVPTVVRVPSKDYKDIARTLDAGAEGVMLPMVSTAAGAEAIIHCIKYPPTGGRGVILRSAHDRYTAGPTLEKLSEANARTAFFAQIETAEGVENAKDIAALPDVDCLWVGHYRSVLLARHPGRVRQSRLHRRHRRCVGCLQGDEHLGRPPGARRRRRRRALQARLRFHRLFRRRLGLGRCREGRTCADPDRLRRLRTDGNSTES